MAVRQIRRVVRAGRRSTIGNRVTGYNLFEGSNPLLSAKKKRVATAALFLFLFKIKARDSNKEGANEVCGKKQSTGLFLPTGQRAKRGDKRG